MLFSKFNIIVTVFGVILITPFVWSRVLTILKKAYINALQRKEEALIARFARDKRFAKNMLVRAHTRTKIMDMLEIFNRLKNNGNITFKSVRMFEDALSAIEKQIERDITSGLFHKRAMSFSPAQKHKREY